MAQSTLLLLVLLATSLALVFGASASSQDVETQDNAVPSNTKAGDLLTRLLRHYSKADHPGGDGPVTISHGLSIIKLKELDVEDQSLSLVGFETWSWQDPRLAWTIQGENGVATLHVNLNRLWAPDIYLFNSNGKAEEMLDTKAVIGSTGYVTFVMPRVVNAICNTTQQSCAQTCDLKYGSWTHNGNDINIVPMETTADVSHYFPNPKWTLLGTAATRHVKKYPCCPEDYIDVTYSLRFKCARKNRKVQRNRNRHEGRE